jgi:hypothetical protein
MIPKKYFVAEHDMFKAYPNKYEITSKDFVLIVKTFFFIMVRSMIYDYKIYKLPYGLGHLGIYKRKTIGRGYFDWDLWKKEGLKRWKKNLHTHGYAAQGRWDTRYPKVQHYSEVAIFKFKLARDSARELGQYILKNNVIHNYYDY